LIPHPVPLEQQQIDRRNGRGICTLICHTKYYLVLLLPFRSGDYEILWWRSPQTSPWPRRATLSIFWWRQRDDLANTRDLPGYPTWERRHHSVHNPSKRKIWRQHNLIPYFIPCFNLWLQVEVISYWCAYLYVWVHTFVPILWTIL
jgi:hypothetical protein